MFAIRTSKALLNIARSIFSIGRVSNPASQRGASTLALALIGLLVGSSLAAPAVQLILGSYTGTAGPTASLDARSAAEHALWRLRYDPTVHDDFIGSPPEVDYVLGFPSGNAFVNIEASSDPPPDNGLTASLTVTPQLVLDDTPTVVTYTLTMTNDDTEAHDIIRFEADPHGSYSPVFVPASTTGATTDDPVYQAGRWRWYLITPLSVPGFGGTASISFQVTVDEGEGQYWLRGTVRVDGIGNVDAPLSGGVRANAANDIVVTTTITPNEVVAGTFQTFTFTIEVTNNSDTDDATVEFVKHWTSTLFDHNSGTTSGMSIADPSRNHDVINSRWEWTWNISGVVLEPYESDTISFDMTATLFPDTYFATSGVRTEEDDNSNGQETTAATGDTAPITVVRSYTITAVHNGEVVTVVAHVTTSGVDVISWVES